MSSSSSGGIVGSVAAAAASATAYDFVGLPGSSSSGSGNSITNPISASSSAAAAAAATTTVTQQQNQGMAGLLIMLAVLCFIFAYCCWGAPFCRSLCRRYCCCCCFCRALLSDDATTTCTDSESGGFVSSTANVRSNMMTTTTTTTMNGGRRNHSNSNDPSMLSTPTIILLPHGRMLVVDGTIFTQLQADSTGLDFVELGESVMRAQRNPSNVNCRQLQASQASIIEMDAETPSKDSMGSIGCFPPPTYESIYGKEETGDMPPSYSDILLHRLANLPFEIEDYSRDSKDEVVENRSLDNCPHIINNPFASHHHQQQHHHHRSRAAASSISNERNYSSLPRNPSVQCNPLDAYFVDNELATATNVTSSSTTSTATRDQRRRSSATALTTCNNVTTAASVARTRRTSSCGDDSPRNNSRTNDTNTQLSRSDNVIDGRFTGSWDEISRAPNDIAAAAAVAVVEAAASSTEPSEQQQHSSRVNPIYGRSRRSITASPDDDDAVQLHRYPEARYISDDDEEEEPQSDDNIGNDDEANNFKVLADIRESRV